MIRQKSGGRFRGGVRLRRVRVAEVGSRRGAGPDRNRMPEPVLHDRLTRIRTGSGVTTRPPQLGDAPWCEFTRMQPQRSWFTWMNRPLPSWWPPHAPADSAATPRVVGPRQAHEEGARREKGAGVRDPSRAAPAPPGGPRRAARRVFAALPLGVSGRSRDPPSWWGPSGSASGAGRSPRELKSPGRRRRRRRTWTRRRRTSSASRFRPRRAPPPPSSRGPSARTARPRGRAAWGRAGDAATAWV